MVDLKHTESSDMITGTLNPSELISKMHPDFLLQLQRYEFDIFKFQARVGREMQMPMIAFGLLYTNHIQDIVDQRKYLNFVKAIYNRYQRNVQYHNDLHGSDVAQHVSFMLNQQNIKEIGLNDLDTLSLIVASLAHDVGHNGFNNGYHKHTQSNLFHLFGDQAIQESFHAAQTIKLLEQRENDFFPKDLTSTGKRLIKKRILVSILQTDMAASSTLHSDMKNHLEVNGIKDGMNIHRFIDRTTSTSQEKSKQLLSSVLLHGADISTSLRKFDVSKTWTDMLFEEFFNQGDIEKSQDIPISFLCDRNTTKIASG